MKDAIEELMLAAIGERLEAIRSMGDGRTAVVTTSLIIYAEACVRDEVGSPLGRKIVGAVPDLVEDVWDVFLEDGSFLCLKGVHAIKRGMTPVFGLPRDPNAN